jgi:autophagy-related protein 2
MSKRLLRYALSRLELLDTDALDMDKQDLTWGMNNILTFQDVGVKLQVSWRRCSKILEKAG